MFFARAVPAKLTEFLLVISLSFISVSSNTVHESLCGSSCNVKENDFRYRIYVLFVGLSGSGKSTTINLLFNASIAEVGDFESTTSEIHEYSLSISNSRYNDTELRIIDTPGLEDTNGLEHDARFLATLEEYFKNHQELRYRPPDVVLICSRFDDNRFYGHSAKFVKMLRAISSLRNLFVNPNYSNLIFVMTHYMGVSEAEAQNPEPKKLDVQNAIKDFSLLPNPIRIVLAENKGEDQELEKVSLGYKLPNGEIYPQNLYNSVKEVLMLSDSGEAKSGVVSSLCTRGNNSSLNVRAISQTPLVQKQDLRAKKLLEQLTAANFKTEDTEISLHLSNVFKNLPGKSQLPPDTLQYFQKALHLRGITKLDDVPRSDFEISSLFRQLNRKNDAELLFKAAFGIEGSLLPFQTLVGNGYDISQDSVVESATPFDLIQSKKCPRLFSQLGYISPPCVIATLDSNTKFYYRKFGSADEYARHRADSLGISKSLMSNSVLSLKPGRNLISEGSCPSLLIEFRTVKMELSEVELNRKYLTQLEQLPEFNISSPSSIQKWSRFLQFHGTHVTTSAYGGGSIQITWDKYNCSNTPSLVDLFQNILTKKETDSVLLQSMANQVSVKLRGGDMEYHAQNPALFFGERDGTSLFTLWKNSLDNKPTELYNYIEIKPISEYIRIANKIPLSEKLNKAARFFLEDQSDEHPLVAKIKEFTNENRNLEKSVKQIGEEKAELEKSLKKLNEEKGELQKRILQMTQELMTTKTSLNEALIKLQVEKGTVASLTAEVQSLKTDKSNLQNSVRRIGEERDEANRLTLQKIEYWKTKEAEMQSLWAMELSRPKVGTPCGEIIKGSSGTISYKKYSSYDNDERCAWIVRVPQSYSKIKFTKQETDFELDCDYITIYNFKNNGELAAWGHLGKAQNSEREFTLEGNVAVVVFATDGSVTNQGFVLNFEGQGSSSDSRSVSYHNDYISGSSMGHFKYPINGTYHDNELSVFVISKLYRKNSFSISIPNGSLEDSTDCAYDRLKVYRIKDDRAYEYHTKCGNFDNFEWSGNNLFIAVLATDSSGTYNGFELSWK